MKTYEKHALWLRIHHWLNVPFLCLMIWSGALIYWANDIYPGFFPEWFYDLFALRSRLAEGLAVHFLVGWLFVANGVGYLFYLILSGHWRELFPTRQTLREIVPVILHDLGLRQHVPPQGKFNAAQRLAYTGVIGLAIVAVLSGFAIYKPVQLAWLTAVFTGYSGARLVHFAVMLAFTGFIGMHLVQVIRAGWNGFRAMVAGFEVEDDRHK
jgi:thiosulfate reductase cytochrome b subunit